MNRTLCPTCLAMSLCLSLTLFSQSELPVHFSSGTIFFPENIYDKLEKQASLDGQTIGGYFYKFLQFNQLPTEQVHEEIRQSGIMLLDYIPDNTYTAAIPMDLDLTVLSAIGVRSVQTIRETFKLSDELQRRDFPAWALYKNDLHCHLRYHKNIPAERILEYCDTHRIMVISQNRHAPILKVAVAKDRLSEVAALPFVAYLSHTRYRLIFAQNV